MLSAVLAASVVTLYCDVTESMNGKPPTPSEQRVFTVNYGTNEVFVVRGNRAGQVLRAKSITAGSIELPDISTADVFQSTRGNVSANGVERIDRNTGAYRSELRMTMPPVMDGSFVYQGSCKLGPVVPAPSAQF
jgi:hypothetical protein